MSQRIIIRHLSGSRAHQTDEFKSDGLRAIVAGRGELADIRLDPQRDDMVSREHLRIAPQSPGSETFLVSDLNSRNGTYVNHARIGQAQAIQHNDVVQLGPQGPEFRFELDPPPATAPSRPTRLVESDQGALSRGMPTREVSFAETSAPRPIGRATVERMLGDTFGKVKRESNKTLWIGVAALALIGVLGATTLVVLHRSSGENSVKAQQQQQLLLQLAQTVRQPRPTDPAMTSRIDQMSSALAKMMAENRQEGGKAPTGSKTQAALGAPVEGSPQGGSDTGGAASQSYEEAFARASDSYRSGDAASAYSESVALISADGGRYEAYFLAALSLSAMQRPSDAVPIYQYALQAAPDAAKAGIQQKLEEAQRAVQQ